MNSWVTYGENSSLARKILMVEQQQVNLVICIGDDGAYTLLIEAGIDSVSVVLQSRELEPACEEADEFTRAYFFDKARLFEKIANKI